MARWGPRGVCGLAGGDCAGGVSDGFQRSTKAGDAQWSQWGATGPSRASGKGFGVTSSASLSPTRAFIHVVLELLAANFEVVQNEK